MCSSAGRASRCQREGRGFETRHALQTYARCRIAARRLRTFDEKFDSFRACHAILGRCLPRMPRRDAATAARTTRGTSSRYLREMRGTASAIETTCKRSGNLGAAWIVDTTIGGPWISIMCAEPRRLGFPRWWCQAEVLLRLMKKLRSVIWCVRTVIGFVLRRDRHGGGAAGPRGTRCGPERGTRQGSIPSATDQTHAVGAGAHRRFQTFESRARHLDTAPDTPPPLEAEQGFLSPAGGFDSYRRNQIDRV